MLLWWNFVYIMKRKKGEIFWVINFRYICFSDVILYRILYYLSLVYVFVFKMGFINRWEIRIIMNKMLYKFKVLLKMINVRIVIRLKKNN